MNLIISGSRHWEDYPKFEAHIMEFVNIGAIHCVWAGEATGVDAMADRFARAWEIDFTRLHAKWTRDLKKAGPIRNNRLAVVLNRSDKAIAFPGPNSKGTVDFIKRAEKFVYGDNLKIVQVDR